MNQAISINEDGDVSIPCYDEDYLIAGYVILTMEEIYMAVDTLKYKLANKQEMEEIKLKKKQEKYKRYNSDFIQYIKEQITDRNKDQLTSDVLRSNYIEYLLVNQKNTEDVTGVKEYLKENVAETNKLFTSVIEEMGANDLANLQRLKEIYEKN